MCWFTAVHFSAHLKCIRGHYYGCKCIRGCAVRFGHGMASNSTDSSDIFTGIKPFPVTFFLSVSLFHSLSLFPSANFVRGNHTDMLYGSVLPGSDARTLELINVTMSCFSFVACIFVFVTYWRFKSIQNFAFRLVLYVACCDFWYSLGIPSSLSYSAVLQRSQWILLGNFLGDAGGNSHTHVGASSSLCTFQALLISYFGLASMLW